LNAGYLGRPEETAAAWSQRLVHTGDVLTRRRGLATSYFVDRSRTRSAGRDETFLPPKAEADGTSTPAILAVGRGAAPSELAATRVKVFSSCGQVSHWLRAASSSPHPRMSQYMSAPPRFVEIR